MATFTDKSSRRISRKDADRMFNNFIKIKKRCLNTLLESFKHDDDAKRFYCGRHDKTPITEDLAFFFDKSSIERLWNKIKDIDNSGLVIFPGVRSSTDSITDNCETNDVDGRPTLIVFPFQYEEVEEPNKTAGQFNIFLNDGEEHPGTGDGNGTKPSPVSIPARIPEVFRAEDVHSLALSIV